MAQINRVALQARLNTYLIDRYLNLHNILVGLALGTAGLAAASLISQPAEYRDYQASFWVLWVASLLAVATAYAGAVVGSVLLPPLVPGVVDVVIPLVLGMLEFLLFGILANKLTTLSSPVPVMTAWFCAFTVFCIIAALAVWRAAQILKPGGFADDIRPGVESYLLGQRFDIAAALLLATISAAGALVNMLMDRPVIVDRVFAGVIAGGLTAALAAHQRAAGKLRNAIHPPTSSPAK
ncbi:hypothetical protein DFR70_110242 [Nocardia tenerifensis]|uniref:Uncharacterized protein n=1 Tax=Nocardia tenerifensis TaxID=228006 RepID=A0A318JWH9_9NOCA|nr:hypothetical protein [Nocardia tenerifensis]PXX60400.1 hypothetical protein DFR70_110242 [Nocardia tenerifensis]